MSGKFRKQCAAFIFTVITAAAFTSCSNNDSKIVGTWKKLNVEDNATVTFTDKGDFNFKFESKTGTKATSGTSSGKYEVKGDILRLYDAPPKNGKDTNVKIIRLEDNSLILESEVKGEKVQEKYEKIGGGVAKPPEQADSKPNVKEVPLVEPWASMNLPCKNGGVVIVARFC